MRGWHYNGGIKGNGGKSVLDNFWAISEGGDITGAIKRGTTVFKNEKKNESTKKKSRKNV